MFGIQSALMDILLQGTRFKPAAAKEKGIVDELVATREDLVPAAKKWIQANQDDPKAASNPWDREGYKIPGGTPSSPSLAAFLPAFPAMLRKQTKGALYPAPRAIMAAAIEGAQVDFDTASRIESRYLAELVTGSNSKNMIQAFFFDLSAINGGALRPKDVPTFTPTKVGVLGAGMMGAGIAYSCARAGMQVVLKDVEQASADKGKAYSEKILAKAVGRGKMDEAKKAEILDRITATTAPTDLAGCDLVIEAVFEDASLKAKVFAEIQDVVNPDALLCSNTSTLPITELAEGVSRPADFVGLHFFSPVDKMPLVEIIRGEKTTDETVAKALDVVTAIRKTPIVVNDSRGFYTSRVIGTMVMEGLAMLGEGVHPMSVERAATLAGYPVGTLQLSDELNMELMAKIQKATADAAERDGIVVPAHPGDAGRDHDDRGGSPRPAPRQGLLRLRRERWPRRAVAGPQGPVPAEGPAGRHRGPQGPLPVHRGPRDREVLRGARHRVGGRGQHRLDHGHRLPGADRRHRAVHAGVRRADRPGPEGVHRPGPRAGRHLRRAVHPDAVARRALGEGRVLSRLISSSAAKRRTRAFPGRRFAHFGQSYRAIPDVIG